jgi:hypothetical protein
VALTIAEIERELQVPWATRFARARNPFYAISKPPTSETAPAAQPPECLTGYEYPLNR